MVVEFGFMVARAVQFVLVWKFAQEAVEVLHQPEEVVRAQLCMQHIRMNEDTDETRTVAPIARVNENIAIRDRRHVAVVTHVRVGNANLRQR